MRDYAALESLKTAQKTIINDAFDKGYEQGYADGKKAVAAELNFEKGYEEGLKRGQELQIKETKCAEACGMKRAWEAARKIMHMSLFDFNKLFPGWDIEDVIDKLSVKEAVERIEAWEKKQKQLEKTCNNCKWMDSNLGCQNSCICRRNSLWKVKD